MNAENLHVLKCPYCGRKCGMYMTTEEYSIYENINAKLQCMGCEESYLIIPNQHIGLRCEIAPHCSTVQQSDSK